MASTESLIVELDARTGKLDSKLEKSTMLVDKLGKHTGKLDKQLVNTSRAMGGLGRNAGMAGIQVQQFIGQVQGGQSAMLALSQQSADLGFVLGAPLVGAVVGIAASFAGMLLPELFTTNEAIEEMEANIEGLIKTFNDLTAAQKAAATAGLQQQLREAAESLAKLKTEAAEAANELRRSEYLERVGGVFEFFADKEGDTKAVIAIDTALAAAEIKVQNIAKQLRNLDAGREAGSDVSTEEAAALSKQADIELAFWRDHFIRLEGMRQIALGEARAAEEQFALELEEFKLTGDETEQERFDKEVAMHASMLEKKLINEKQFAAVQAQSVQRFIIDKKKEAAALKLIELKKLNNQEAMIGLGMAANTMLFNDNKAIAAGLIIADTAVGIQKSLSINPYDYVNVGIIAATGAANLANAANASKGGGSVSSPSSSGGGGGSSSSGQSFQAETSSLELTDQDAEGSVQVIRVEFATDSGDSLIDSLAEGLNESMRQGR